MQPLIHSLENLHTIESSLDEEDSYILLQYLNISPIYSEKYIFPPISQLIVSAIATSFSFFSAKIKDQKTNQLYSSNIPLTIFRYLMLPDGTWSYYYTVKRKVGYVVEGMQWSNGYFYQVREDKEQDFKLYQINLSIDSFTKRLYNFLEPSDLYENPS